mmetsp:Transcript_126044/g.251632  ORF Transcript_126044/g.251632 Transcript_126044/m.251632 type:complete len:82 (+) Transcript_126044:467-712(+)
MRMVTELSTSVNSPVGLGHVLAYHLVCGVLAVCALLDVLPLVKSLDALVKLMRRAMVSGANASTASTKLGCIVTKPSKLVK